MPDHPSAHAIFVHGLEGDSYRTWLSSTRMPEFWPDWLSEDIPQLAIWSLGYEATWTWWKDGGAQALPDRAASVLPILAHEKDLQDGNIYFVAHSLGGLVVEAVLRFADLRAPRSSEVSSFLSRVRKVAFIGTPHRGSDHASIANSLRILRSRETTAGLSRNDAHLRDLNTWFRHFADQHKLQALVLRETKAIPVLGLRGLGGIIVKPDSSDPGLSPDTEIIPIDADHFQIVKPKTRTDAVYKNLLRFLEQPVDSRYHDLTIVDAVKEIEQSVDLSSVKLAIQADENKQEVLRAIQEASVPVGESSVITNELDRRLWVLRKSRFIAGFDSTEQAERLVGEIGQGGDLALASVSQKCFALAWCARILAANAVQAARAALAQARLTGSSDEIIIAEAFIEGIGNGNKANGLAHLAGLTTPEAKTASFMIGVAEMTPADALQWLSDAGITMAMLDSDGRFAVLQRLFSAGNVERALSEATVLDESDYERTPVLLDLMAMLHLAAAVHPELRDSVFQQLPLGLDQVPLNASADALEHRRLAQVYYGRAKVAFSELEQERAANLCADHELWLALKDNESDSAALRILENSMSDPQHRLRRLPMAIAFGLKLDRKAIESELDREATRTGGKSANLAVARFAMARDHIDQREVAAYVDRYRDQLIFYFTPLWIKAFEAEALAKSGQIEKAKAALDELRIWEAPSGMLEGLGRLIDEAAGKDPVEAAERQFLKGDRRFADLLNLFRIVRSAQLWPKVAIYGRELFKETNELAHGIACAEGLYQTGQYSELFDLAKDSVALAASPTFKHIEAWAYFRLGDLPAAKKLVKESIDGSTPESTRTLETNIAIASGDWNALTIQVEDQWNRRDELSAKDLVLAGQLAAHIGSTRERDLLTEAARRADGDPAILVACYNAAVSGGWDDSEETHKWFEVAVVNSGADGPVQRVDFRQLLDMAPDWNKRESDAWDALLKGRLPMHAAASLVNRSPMEMFWMTALANLSEPDPRKRGFVFAYSGNRPLYQVGARCAAFDVSALMTLAITGQLDNAFGLFESIRLPHRTMGWLLEQRHTVEFHQPSRVNDAEELRRLVDIGALIIFEPIEPADVRLETEFGDELAAMISAATFGAANSPGREFVVRSYPVHKPGSLMEEISNSSGYENVLVDCRAIVDSLKRLGHLTEAQENRANSFLSTQELDWPHDLPEIPRAATLYLDGLSVSHLQHLGLLGVLKSAGFKVYISAREIANSDALLRRRAFTGAIQKQIEDIRSKVLDGIQTGRVRLGPQTDFSEDESSPLNLHPSQGLFKIADADVFVVDDRCFNQHSQIEVAPSDRRAIHTTLDLFEAIRGNETISEIEFAELLTKLRTAGFVLIPIFPTELAAAISRAAIKDGKLQETAELRSIREALLTVRMTDILQVPNEAHWLDWNLAVIVQAIHWQWTSEIPDEVARARSNWLVRLFDFRGWAHRLEDIDTEERRASQIFLLSRRPPVVQDVGRRHQLWFEQEVLSPIKEYEPRLYTRILAAARLAIETTAEQFDSETGGLREP